MDQCSIVKCDRKKHVKPKWNNNCTLERTVRKPRGMKLMLRHDTGPYHTKTLKGTEGIPSYEFLSLVKPKKQVTNVIKCKALKWKSPRFGAYREVLPNHPMPPTPANPKTLIGQGSLVIGQVPMVELHFPPNSWNKFLTWVPFLPSRNPKPWL